MTNIYWPIYKNLESEIEKLTYDIYINDDQLDVYSTKISELILRSAVEIESLAKDLYWQNGGNKEHIKFDEDALKFLNQKWNLEQKVVIISSPNCHQTNKILFPFNKSEKKPNNKLTYTWNNAYQHLKHNRANNYKFGSIKYLFDILGALFILNIYYKDEKYDLENSKKTIDFPLNQGSILFSIKIHKWFKYDGNFKYGKKDDFDECVYLTKYSNKTMENHRQIREKMRVKEMELTRKHPKFIEYIKTNDLRNYKGQNLMAELLTSDEHLSFLRQIVSPEDRDYIFELEAVTNKNCI